MAESAINKRVMSFSSGAVADDSLLLTKLAGSEELSRLYSYELELISDKVDLDFDKLLKEPAKVGIKQGVKLAGENRRGAQTLKIHGMLSKFEQIERRLDLVRYKATLVPRLWKLGLTYESRVFQDKTVKEIIADVMKEAGFTTDDYEIKAGNGYAKREFVVQYEETDLDFLYRWLEHEGIFFFFDNSGEKDKIIFGDAVGHYPRIQGNSNIPYRPTADNNARSEGAESESASTDWFKEEVINLFSCRQSVIPREVVLKDYNYRKPSETLRVVTQVSQNGVGRVYEYNNHYKTEDEGKALGNIRAQEIVCREKIFSGASDCRAFRGGATFELQEHYRNDYNREYLITHVSHNAEQSIQFSSGNTLGASYNNAFVCIPSDRLFRPERTTKWPAIHGIINATVDAAGSGDYAEIDDQGRYKVKLPFDLSDKKDGKASRYLRMAQPYSGEGMGMHFPLHKGTEVLVTCVDGDPDRMVISASIPNPETESPVTSDNQTQSQIQTGGGNVITMEDQDGSQHVTIESPTQGTVIRIGSNSGEEGEGSAGEGVHIATDGDHTQETGGDENKTIEGDETTIIEGDKEETIKGNKEESVDGHVKEFIDKGTEAYNMGNFSEYILGMNSSTVLGMEASTVAPLKRDGVYGISMESVLGMTVETFKGLKLSHEKGISFEVSDVKKYEFEAHHGKKVPGIFATIAGIGKYIYNRHKLMSQASTQIAAAAALQVEAGNMEMSALRAEAIFGSDHTDCTEMRQRAQQLTQEATLWEAKAAATKISALNIDIGAGAFTIVGGGAPPVVPPAVPKVAAASVAAESAAAVAENAAAEAAANVASAAAPSQ
ncbi:MAG: type VI secretion system tip protein VgrG [Planctomycetes bacterium]|nr:type VI secretion system tip protein VgrG [Planctomycetota bacterium]